MKSSSHLVRMLNAKRSLSNQLRGISDQVARTLSKLRRRMKRDSPREVAHEVEDRFSMRYMICLSLFYSQSSMPRKPFAKGGRNYMTKVKREEIMRSEKIKRDARRAARRQMNNIKQWRPLTTSPTPIIMLLPSSSSYYTSDSGSTSP